MKRIVPIIISIFALSISYAIAQTPNQTTSSEDTIKSFITKMYNDKLYEDYDFLQKHCSPELLKKLQEAYPYDSDGPAYASWLFRSGQQESKPGSDGKTMMLDVKADGDWYVYTALDMGWEFTNRIKVTCPDGKIIIEDMDLTGEWAKAFVRNSYIYRWHKTQDVDSTVMAFCEIAKHLMPDIQLNPSAIKDKCYNEISIELYGNDHDIIGNREIVKYLIKTEK